MAGFERFLNTLDGWLGAAFYFPWLLLLVGAFFTLYLGFPQLRYFKRAWGILLGRHTRADADGDATPFQALSTALSGTVGTGNIVGVALAISLGGPAALFWMWATAFVGMTTKFVEVTISHKYRVKDDQGRIAGGPMYVLERGLKLDIRLGPRVLRIGKWLAVFFAAATVLSTIGSSCMPQANSIAAGLNTSFGLPTWVSGLALGGLMFVVIVGGIRSIARVAAAIVPVMGLLYALGAFAVVAANVENVVPSFLAVFRDAFTGTAAVGGFLGASFAFAFNRGVNRGLYSNEAGQGSAPIAHAAAKGDEPVSEGMVSLLEPFIDTLLICTLTGLAILSSGVWQEKFPNEFQHFDMAFVQGEYSDDRPADVRTLYDHLHGVSRLPAADGTFDVADGRLVDAPITILHNRSVAEEVRFYVDGEPLDGTVTIAQGTLEGDVMVYGKSLLHSVKLTAAAFGTSFLGDYGPYLVSICLLLFAFTTAVTWSYYGDRSLTYLCNGRTWAVLPYRLLYVVAFFVATVADTSLIWLIAAVTMALMALPNLLGISLLAREVKTTVQDYWRAARS